MAVVVKFAEDVCFHAPRNHQALTIHDQGSKLHVQHAELVSFFEELTEWSSLRDLFPAVLNLFCYHPEQVVLLLTFAYFFQLLRARWELTDDSSAVFEHFLFHDGAYPVFRHFPWIS